MRQQLEELIRNVIIIQTTLTGDKKSKISLYDDQCLRSLDDEGLKQIIYEWIIEYAYNEFDITAKDLNVLHRNALVSKLKYNHEASDETKEKYWFYGEILLDCVLKVLFWTSALISRGYFYNPLENGETKWFDCYHLIESQENLYLYYGETKFYANTKKWIKSVLDKIETSLSDVYLSTNMIALINHKDKIMSNTIADILSCWEIQAINLVESLRDNNIILVYPIFIIGNYIKQNYDDNIQEQLQYIESLLPIPKDISLSISYKIFFIFLPVQNTKDIKQTIIQWIKESKPLQL